MTSMSGLLQDSFCGKNSWKSIKYSQSYDAVCQLALLGFKGEIIVLKTSDFRRNSALNSQWDLTI